MKTQENTIARAFYTERPEMTTWNIANGKNVSKKKTLTLDGKETTPFDEFRIRYMAWMIGLTYEDFGATKENAPFCVNDCIVSLSRGEYLWLEENGLLEIAKSRHGLHEHTYKGSKCYAVIKKSTLGRKMQSNRGGVCWFSGKKFAAGAIIWYNGQMQTSQVVLDSEISRVC